jgi:polysaccharide deacetylase family protein (PEP-CTERM system associated)
MNTNRQINILTIDIEEWYHTGVLLTEEEWRNHPPRIDLYLPQVLDKLDEHNITATFFCLGWIARNYPGVIKRIQQCGHEIACHTDMHPFIRKMTPDTFAQDLKMSLDSIQDITGEKINTFRAPAFSISEDSTWAFQVLAEHGIEIDCSIFPADRSFGGFPSFGEAIPTLIKYKNCLIKELPISAKTILGRQIVFSGGGYFRLFPYWMIRKIMNGLDYNMTYLHMRDFDVEQYRFKNVSMMRYFKLYYGIRSAFPKFEKLLRDFKWMNVKQAVQLIDFETVKIVELN